MLAFFVDRRNISKQLILIVLHNFYDCKIIGLVYWKNYFIIQNFSNHIDYFTMKRKYILVYQWNKSVLPNDRRIKVVLKTLSSCCFKLIMDGQFSSMTMMRY